MFESYEYQPTVSHTKLHATVASPQSPSNNSPHSFVSVGVPFSQATAPSGIQVELTSHVQEAVSKSQLSVASLQLSVEQVRPSSHVIAV